MQKSYSYTTPKGVAGGLMDLSPYSVDSRVNGETTPGALKFGMGVVQGTTPGTNVALPTAAATADKFEGLLLTGFVQEMDAEGSVAVKPKQTVGVLRYGKAWARVPKNTTAAYGDKLYLITSGNNAGLFTNVATGNLAVNGRFIGTADTTDVAPVEIFNQSAATAAEIGALDERVTALETADNS